MSCIRKKRGPYRKQVTDLNSGNICEVDDDFQEVTVVLRKKKSRNDSLQHSHRKTRRVVEIQEQTSQEDVDWDSTTDTQDLPDITDGPTSGEDEGF